MKPDASRQAIQRRRNLLGHVVTAVLTATLCGALGRLFSGLGVAAGYATAVAIGSTVAIVVCRGRLAGSSS